MSDMVYRLIQFLGFSLIGWIFLGVAIHGKRYQRKKEEAERLLTTGTIVGIVEKSTHPVRGRPTKYYVPVVAFYANGKEYKLENENGSREKEKIILGKSVDVMYDEHDPMHFHLVQDDANAGSASSLLRFGLLIILGAAVLVVLDSAFHIL